MVDSQVIAFALAAAALTIAPGPDTMLVLRNVLRGGRRAGIITTLGIGSGLFAHATLSAMGISILLARSATAFSVLKLLGACYLGWLGLQSLRRALSSRQPPEDVVLPSASDTRSVRRCFVEGVLSNVLNPKTVAFYLAFLPQFIGPEDDVFGRSLLLAGIHYVEAVVWLVGLSILFDRMRRSIMPSAVRRWLDGLCGVMLVAFGARLVLGRR